ncbi:MAG: hypothetical protein U0S76_04410 [Pseudoxanthomonas sp.]|nr:hypothetical protein [Pseudoxanthomonas sp.]
MAMTCRSTRYPALAALLVAQSVVAQPQIVFVPLTPTSVAVPLNATATVAYEVRNTTSLPRQLVMVPIPGVVQLEQGPGRCTPAVPVPANGNCVLELLLQGSALPAAGVSGGPVMCIGGNPNQCFQPSAANALQITVAAPLLANLEALPASLAFPAGGSGALTVLHLGEPAVVVENLRVVVPGGVDIDVDLASCAGSLFPGGDCTLVLSAQQPQAGVLLSVEGDHSVPVPVEVTVTDVLFADGFDS